MNKKAKNNLLMVSIFVLVATFSLYFVFSAQTITKAGGTETTWYLNEGTEYTLNFTINHTASGTGANLTQVNVTLPSSLTSRAGAFNGTDAFSTTDDGFLNISTSLSWFNFTDYVINVSSGDASSFWFNATALTPGWSTLNITTYNSSGGTQTLLSILINDTDTAPMVNISESGLVPVDYGNYSGNLNLNLYINDSYGTVDTVIFMLTNVSGDQNASYNYTASSSDSKYWNATINTAHILPAGTNWYNVTVYANDTYGNLNNSETIYSLTFDNVAPSWIGNFTTTNLNSGENYTKARNLLLNVTVRSLGVSNVSAVYFNITKSNGQQNVSYSAYKNYTTDGNGYSVWNYTFNTNDLGTDDTYNLSVVAVDYAGNQNSTQLISNFIVDNTAPTVTLTKDSTSSTTDTLVINIAASDALLAVNFTCTSDKPSATLSGSDESQTLTESSLNCGATYAYTVYCKDSVGNLGASASTSFTTDSCDSGSSSSSSGSSGGSSSTWSTTHTITESQFAEGVTKQLAKKERIKFEFDGEDHHVGVKSISGEKVTVEIASTPVTIEFDVGEDAKVDLNDDGTYDVYVILNAVEDNKADLTVKEINEVIVVSDEDQGTTPGVETSGEIVTPDSGSKGGLLIAIIVLLVLAAAIGGGVAYKKRR